MPHYNVTVSLGTLTTDVEAANEDEAITAACEEWEQDADFILSGGTFTVDEFDPDE